MKSSGRLKRLNLQEAIMCNNSDMHEHSLRMHNYAFLPCTFVLNLEPITHPRIPVPVPGLASLGNWNETLAYACHVIITVYKCDGAGAR